MRESAKPRDLQKRAMAHAVPDKDLGLAPNLRVVHQLAVELLECTDRHQAVAQAREDVRARLRQLARRDCDRLGVRRQVPFPAVDNGAGARAHRLGERLLDTEGVEERIKTALHLAALKLLLGRQQKVVDVRQDLVVAVTDVGGTRPAEALVDADLVEDATDELNKALARGRRGRDTIGDVCPATIGRTWSKSWRKASDRSRRAIKFLSMSRSPYVISLGSVVIRHASSTMNSFNAYVPVARYLALRIARSADMVPSVAFLGTLKKLI